MIAVTITNRRKPKPMMILPNAASLDCLPFCGIATMRAFPNYVAVPFIWKEIILTLFAAPVFALMM
eukprot:7901417-Karenia_brevis.AAC.1